MDINDIVLSPKYVGEIGEQRETTQLMAQYYDDLADFTRNQNLHNIADNMRDCYHIWVFNSYNLSRIRDMKHVSLCHNRFCLNCAKERQRSRLKKFTPVLDEFLKEGDLYHCVFTMPNVLADDLIDSINLLYKSFLFLVGYLKNKIKIKGLDFSFLGYKGALRALEVTYSKKDYHPHLHCLLLLQRDLVMSKTHINKYSYNRRFLERYFSDFEVLIQKIWYLLINKQKVTLESIKKLDLGYSCIIDKVDKESYYQVFKYATKFFSDDKKEVMNFEQFKALYYAFYNRRTIQGYGCMFRIHGSEEDDIDESVDNIYDDYIEHLNSIEVPEAVFLSVGKLYNELYNRNFTYISRRKLYQFFKNEYARESGVILKFDVVKDKFDYTKFDITKELLIDDIRQILSVCFSNSIDRDKCIDLIENACLDNKDTLYNFYDVYLTASVTDKKMKARLHFQFNKILSKISFADYLKVRFSA